MATDEYGAPRGDRRDAARPSPGTDGPHPGDARWDDPRWDDPRWADPRRAAPRGPNENGRYPGAGRSDEERHRDEQRYLEEFRNPGRGDPGRAGRPDAVGAGRADRGRWAGPDQPRTAARPTRPGRSGVRVVGGGGARRPAGAGGGPGFGTDGAGRPEGGWPPTVRGSHVVRLALYSVLAGLVLAGITFPAVGALGVFSKASSDHFVALPSNLVTPPLSENSRILAADGQTIATLRGATDRVYAPLSTIPPIMQKAIVDIEDSRFYSHGGVDVKGMLRAAVHDSSSDEGQQGGSTLTQQYVKNVLLQQATTSQERENAAGDSLARKLQEARYAVALEKKLTKQQILERYLNISYFGDGAYGIGTASQHYFGRSVKLLTLPQAALLAGLVQSPSAYDPFTDPTTARTRRNIVLDRMAQLDTITTAEATAAKAAPLGVRKAAPAVQVDSCQSSAAPFFCDYVRTQLLADPKLGATLQARQHTLYEGGLTIRTTLDLSVQNAVQATVNQVIDPANRVSGSEVVIQPGTGNILAMAVNRYYGTNTAGGQTKVNLATTPSFYPGSTFKAFTLATALEQGYGESTSFYSPYCLDTQEITQAFPRGNSPVNCQDGFKNDTKGEAGVYDLSKATWDSVNTYYVQLEAKVGVPAVVDMAERVGLPAKLMREGGIPGQPPVQSAYGEFTLGAVFMDPLDMADAYATFAAHGLRCAPRYIASATDSAGQALAVATAPQCKQAVAPGIADTVTSILTGVVTQGTGNPNAAAIGRPAAGKTGTNDNYASAWFVGYTPQMAAAVAVGDPRGQSGYPLTNVVADGRTWSPGVYGGDLPAIIFGQSMKAALTNQPVEQFAPADPTVVQGTKGGLLSSPPPSTATPTPTAGASGAPGATATPNPGITLPGIGPILPPGN